MCGCVVCAVCMCDVCICGMCVCVYGRKGGGGATQTFRQYILPAIQHTCNKELLPKI